MVPMPFWSAAITTGAPETALARISFAPCPFSNATYETGFEQCRTVCDRDCVGPYKFLPHPRRQDAERCDSLGRRRSDLGTSARLEARDHRDVVLFFPPTGPIWMSTYGRGLWQVTSSHTPPSSGRCEFPAAAGSSPAAESTRGDPASRRAAAPIQWVAGRRRVRHVYRAIASDAEIRVMVVAAEGSDPSAGHDLREMLARCAAKASMPSSTNGRPCGTPVSQIEMHVEGSGETHYDVPSSLVQRSRKCRE